MQKIIFNIIREDLCNLHIKELFDHVNEALTIGFAPMEIIREGLIEGLKDLAKRMDEGKAFSADIVHASSAVDLCCRMLIGGIHKPCNRKFKTVVIGTVKGDFHQIGKSIIKYLLEAEGVNVIDLGCSVDKESFVKAVIDNKDIGLAICSGTLEYSANELRSIVSEIKIYRSDISVIAGGSSFNEIIAREARADIYAKDAEETVKEALKIIEIKGAI